MAFGNLLGVSLNESLKEEEFFLSETGNILAEVTPEGLKSLDIPYMEIGRVTAAKQIKYKKITLKLSDIKEAYDKTLEPVFPTKAYKGKETVPEILCDAPSVHICRNKVAKPKVFIPVFPGSNCEYDSARAFEKAGGEVSIRIFKNLSAQDIRSSVDEYVKEIKDSQIIMFPGGFSAGDEPDGSAKFFATAFRNEKIKEAVMDLINNRDGLVLGVCNGFQALIKLGLVPFGQITESQTEDSPTLTFNTINRHVSKMVYTKVVSNKSPWLLNAELGGVYVDPASHGEGRFVASKERIEGLITAGQIATLYCDADGNISMDEYFNVNGSYGCIEGILSPDGRIFGKMAHIERIGDGVAKNIYGEQDMQVFESGIEYFM